MSLPFTDATRHQIASRCAAFPRLPDADTTLKRAAVTIALAEADAAGEAALLLTLRASSLRAHSNQWALPGGRCDPGETPDVTALRELEEEIGLAPGAGAVLGTLDDYPTRSGYLITPVVAWCSSSAPLRLNPDEVVSVHRIALAEILHDDAFDFITIPESERPVIRFHFRDQRIHAPTAALIYQFRELLSGRHTRVADLEQPVFAWK
jgi:8-oxo-dGTP pyrophosphatase MutT (NUDIX family)